jgi:predicted nucleic acid-binding protein
MIVVADSGPLHYLILLDQTELLHRFYGQVVIPGAVLKELTSGRMPQPVREWLSEPPSWLRVQKVSSSQLELVTDDLDLGEREAIALAHLLQADLLLIDEISVDVPEILARLRDTSFYVDENLIRSIFGKWMDEPPYKRPA